ncbi:hypothetical protein P5G50_09890 [Leifsonia sp. F6_8S_P_1B]|uniref:Uncharacterized protein n=1 Tax=Leifsonia williamsii TaxID=3035919 RepID=A0ABT8KBG7_9MICO|nr:hypothetical protein [Leifsonia williamsii]MDN4614765.1 hypothetical protein [Leifsonia williamsii]
MNQNLDALFDHLTAWEPSVESIDRANGTVFLRARNGRKVTLAVTAADADRLSTRDGFEWMGGATRAERSFGLFLIHLDEGINAFGRQPFTRLVLDEDGLIVPVD